MDKMLNPQKALHLYAELEKKRTKVDEDTFVIFEKYDGIYGMKEVSHKDSGFNRIHTRAKRMLPSTVDLSASIELYEKASMIHIEGTLIFEILVSGKPVFKDLNGILNRSKTPCQAAMAHIIVHDLVVPDKSMPFSERYELAKAYVYALDHSRVSLAPIIGTGTHEDVQKAAESIWQRYDRTVSNEGAIGKRIGAPYSEGKRNKDIIKVKCEVTLEMLVIGLVEGKGKYLGTLGGLRVRQKDGTEHTVSGMADFERDLWYDHPHLIINQVVEIQAMQILPNGSLREGRFKDIRYDKTAKDID